MIEVWYSSDSCTRRLFSFSIPTFGFSVSSSAETSIPESTGSTFYPRSPSGLVASKNLSYQVNKSLSTHFAGEARSDP
jgi:hypothetical protein